LAAVYIVYFPHQNILAEKELRHLAASSEERTNQIVDAIARLREDVQFLAGTPPVAGMGRARLNGGTDPLNGDSEDAWKERLETIFLSFLRRRPEYAQVRLIDYQNRGFELVRVERIAPNLLVIVPPQDLQQKGRTGYAQGAAALLRDEVLLSEISLNREYDRVTIPMMPIIRAATPVFGDGSTPFALVVINHDMSRLFDDMKRARPQGSELYLTNDSGSYLLDTVSSLAFGFDLGRPRRLQSDLPVLDNFFLDDAPEDRGFFDFERRVRGDSEKFVMHMTKVRFDPADPSRFLGLGMYSSYDALLADSSQVGRASTLTASLLVLLGSALILFYIRRLLFPLALVVASTDRVAAGEYDVALPPESDDEIGRLSRSFRSMVHQIRERGLQVEHHKLSLLNINTRLEKARQQLEAKTIELEQQAGQDKSEFLARISHDIRTPLNSMLLLANALADNREQNLTSDQEQSAKVLAGAGADLLALVNDLLDLSKLGAGKLQVAFEEVGAASLIRHVSGQFQPLAAAKGLELIVDLHPDLPRTFVTDPRRLRQILWNLLSNALKYTSAGSVTLTARQTESGLLAFKVRDTGDGIPVDQLERIFSPYHQLDRDVRSSSGGTGLGLSIVKELTAALGGELDVGSQMGEGTWFEVRLPMRAASTEQSEPEKAASPSAAADRRKRVLLADDDAATRWALTRSLQQADPEVRVDEADTGSQALQAIRNQGYHCVILDYHLPQLDGLTVLQALKKEPPATMPQVLLYTGRELDAEESREAQRLGAVVIPKEGAFLPVLEAVRRSFSGQHPADITGRRLLLVEDDSANSFALSQGLMRLGAHVERARDGLEAVLDLENRRDIDAVLMDMRMPVMDGYEAISRIRANPTHDRLPIIALTADATDVDRERCLAAGASSFLPKPVDLPALAREIQVRCAGLARSQPGSPLR
jgi:signal transduction histidine kinase/CheY-like chemotaxis protein